MGNFLNYIPYFPEFLEDYNLTFIHEPFEYQLLDCDYDEVIDKGGVEGMRTESQRLCIFCTLRLCLTWLAFCTCFPVKLKWIMSSARRWCGRTWLLSVNLNGKWRQTSPRPRGFCTTLFGEGNKIRGLRILHQRPLC